MPQGIPLSKPALVTSPALTNINQVPSNPCTMTHGTYSIKPTDHLTTNSNTILQTTYNNMYAVVVVERQRTPRSTLTSNGKVVIA